MSGQELLTVGSLCSGYGGLDLAVEEVFGARVRWFCEFEAAPSTVLAHHWPGVPNHGDMTAIDWAKVEPVDIIAGGTPCQDLSGAGKRAGMTEGTRSNLWVQMREAIAVIRPRFVIWENVRGAYSAYAASEVEHEPGLLGEPYGPDRPALRALGRVVGDLSDLGYDCRWTGVRAADVGAPHGRYRVFVLAHSGGEVGGIRPGLREGRTECVGRGRPGDGDCETAPDPGCLKASEQPISEPGCGVAAIALCGGGVTTDSECSTRRASTGEWAGSDEASGSREASVGGRRGLPSPSDSARDGWNEGWPQSEGIVGRSDAAERGDAAADPIGSGWDGRTSEPVGQPLDGTTPTGGGAVDWGKYRTAIRRWERIIRRPAPAPTEPGMRSGQRLSPRFVEWMMGLTAGHVTDIPDISRNDQLKMLGNGVVPQQAMYALQLLLDAELAVAA